MGIIWIKFKFFIFALLLFFGIQSHAVSWRHDATSYELEYAKQLNRWLRASKINTDVTPTHKPVEDDAQFSYVLLSGVDYDIDEIRELRKQIASNLPANVTLVVLTTTWNAEIVRKRYSTWIHPSRLIITTDSNNDNHNGFWARDAFPIPVRDKETNEISIIAHQYFRPFDSFKTIAKSVSAQFIERKEVFVGGNLIADREGNCFAVDSTRLFDMKAEEIQNIYGCKTIHLLNHVAGIGDIDEVLKPIGNNVMLTNEPVYAPFLRSLGYNVQLLPKLSNTYRTYINSLIIEKVAFMPVFGVDEDLQAQKIYNDLGYKVVPIKSNYLSDTLFGSIHCQTMAYPAVAKKNLLKSLGLREISLREK